MAGAGELDRRIRIEVADTTQDVQSGELSLSWRLLAEIWANVRQPSGSEVFRSEQRVAKVDTIFNVRYREDVSATETFRILYEGRAYDITAVLAPLGATRRTKLDIYAFARAESLPG